jgi:hypothetical protein
MWQNLTRADIECAQQELRLRREQMLARHAEEIRNVDAERAEVEMLAQMAAAFAEKFKKTMTSPYESPATGGRDGNGEEDSSEAHFVPGVSLFITQAQKSTLRERGIADEQIRNMKPSDAHRILGLTG